MQDHWAHFGPPVYMAVAAYFKMTKQRKDRPTRSDMPARPERGARPRDAGMQRVTVADMLKDRAALQEFGRDFASVGGRPG